MEVLELPNSGEYIRVHSNVIYENLQGVNHIKNRPKNPSSHPSSIILSVSAMS